MITSALPRVGYKSCIVHPFISGWSCTAASTSGQKFVYAMAFHPRCGEGEGTGHAVVFCNALGRNARQACAARTSRRLLLRIFHQWQEVLLLWLQTNFNLHQRGVCGNNEMYH
jgi:hypothetical protein